MTYTPPNPPIPGVWIPTGPTPIGPYLGLMRPFSLDSADQFRPDGPPDLRSRKWARDYNEVKEIGSATSTTRTDEQTLAARFWGEAPVQQAAARSASSSSTTSSTSSTRRASWRWRQWSTPTL